MNKWLHKFMEKSDISDNTDNTDISDKPDKWDRNLENMPGEGPDKPDRLGPHLNLSGLSGSPRGLLEENLRNIPEIGPNISDITDKPDISDRLGPNLNLSGLSDFSWGLLEENLEINPSKRGDKSDRFRFEANMSPHEEGLLSVLSVLTQGYLDQKLENIPFPSTDSTDRFDFAAYEERLAIAEYDGHQTFLQAQRIAYLDAFVSVLLTLPHDEGGENWLSHRIAITKSWLLDQGLTEPE